MWLNQIFITFPDGSSVAFVLRPEQTSVTMVGVNKDETESTVWQFTPAQAVQLVLNAFYNNYRIDMYKSVL